MDNSNNSNNNQDEDDDRGAHETINFEQQRTRNERRARLRCEVVRDVGRNDHRSVIVDMFAVARNDKQRKAGRELCQPNEGRTMKDSAELANDRNGPRQYRLIQNYWDIR